MRIREGIKMKNNLHTLGHSIRSPLGIASAIVIVLLASLFYFAFGILAGVIMLVIGYIIALIMVTSFIKSDENKRGN
jgi:uncharacterized membrane protein YGL010W